MLLLLLYFVLNSFGVIPIFKVLTFQYSSLCVLAK